MKSPADRKIRCGWAGDDQRMVRYHDEEWGVPIHDDQKWFEFMVLDAFQAGLSWKIVLHRREAFRRVFHGFDPVRVAVMGDGEVEAACQDASIIRNRRKIRAAVENASRFLEVQRQEGSFDTYVWGFAHGRTVRNAWKRLDQIPPNTDLSDRLSRALKSRGFSFVGSTICYSFLQAGGIVNDHLVTCFRYAEL